MELILNVELFPADVREKLRTTKVSVQERDGYVILMPIQEKIKEEEIQPQEFSMNGSGLLGIAQDSKLTVEKLLAYKREDKELEK